MNQIGKDIGSKKKEVVSLLEEAYASRVNNLVHSIELAEKALLISRQIACNPLIGRSLNQLSLFYMIMGEYKRSTHLSEEAIACFVELNDKKGIADAKYNLAGIYYKSDNFHLGLVYLIDCLAIYRKYKDYHNQARVQKSLGTIYEYFGDQKSAMLAYENAIEMAVRVGDLNLESNAYNPLSGIYLKQNKIVEAEQLIERSIAMKTQTGDTRGLAFALYGRGKVNTQKGLFKLAEVDFLDSLVIHRKMGERLGRAMSYSKLGALYIEMDELDKAKSVLKKGLKFSQTFNIVIAKFKCSYLLYKVYKLENNSLKSLEHLERYLSEKEAVINTQTLKVIENYELINKMKLLERKSRLQMKKAEEQIRLSNERYELATKATKDVIWDWDIINNIIYRSANYGLVFGYSVSENNIYKESWMNNLHHDDGPRVMRNIDKHINDPESNLWEDDYRYYKQNGELAFVKDHGYIIRDANKRAIRMVGAMWDITAQKASEKERETMTNDIIQRNKDLEQFAYIISHNLRAPVANILGFSELLKDDSNTQEQLKEFVEIISASAHTLDHVISDINYILQVKSEVSEMKKNIFFSELVKDIMVSIKNMLEKENVTIRFDFDEVDEFLTLKSYIYSVFYNLIINSIKYRRPDADPIIHIKSLRREGSVILKFKDNGLGIDLEKKGHQVFGLYKRFHTHTEGKGMGLYMTKTQVETMGGRITIRSKVNVGTEFKIEFTL